MIISVNCASKKNSKRSHILQPQNMGPFQFLSWHGKMVSKFSTMKYGTVSNFVLIWKNGLKFWSCKIWDHFNFCPDVQKTVSNSAATKYWTVLMFDLMWWNGLRFCGCEIWDCFNFCPGMAKRSQILQQQNMGPFQFFPCVNKTACSNLW